MTKRLDDKKCLSITWAQSAIGVLLQAFYVLPLTKFVTVDKCVASISPTAYSPDRQTPAFSGTGSLKTHFKNNEKYLVFFLCNSYIMRIFNA